MKNLFFLQVIFFAWKDELWVKVALVTPFYHQHRGNTITVQRISDGLSRLGVVTEIVSSTEEQDNPKLMEADIIHGFNAYHFYQYILQQAPFRIPYLVTMTGTDLNHDLFDNERRNGVIQALCGARAVHVFHKQAKNMLWQEVPCVKHNTFVIPQGTIDFLSVEGKAKKEAGTFLFILPAGIRRVKNIPAAISMLTPLYNKEPTVRLWIAGPIIDEAEGRQVEELIKGNSGWVRYLGLVPHREMGNIYKCADVLLNTSLSEGQSSAILEAMAQGIPVLVSDNAGNRDIVTHGKVGFLYRDEQEFVYYARRLIVDNELRRQMGNFGKGYVNKHHSTEKEVQALLSIYRGILQQSFCLT